MILDLLMLLAVALVCDYFLADGKYLINRLKSLLKKGE